MTMQQKPTINDVLKAVKSFGGTHEIVPDNGYGCKTYYLDAPEGKIWVSSGATMILMRIWTGVNCDADIAEALERVNYGLEDYNEEDEE